MKTMRRSYHVLAAVLIMTICRVSVADANGRIDLPLDAFSVEAVFVKAPPNIDGNLNDAAWKKVEPITNFTQFTPAQEEPASERTYCYIAYDKKNLYFAARCEMRDPTQIASTINNRDAILGDDWIMLLLDSYGDRRAAYEFFVNPYGIQGDAVQYNNQDDISWDAVWKSAGQLTESGWIVEAAIPFTALRFAAGDKLVWRFQIIRRISQNNEMSFYVPMRKCDNNFLVRTADLISLSGIERTQSLSITPYATQKVDRGTRYSGEPDLGADLKYAIKSNLIMDATINPDFSHIEADIEEISITPYELQLMEKRPFFLEKTDIFKTLFDLFYSRRIIDPKAGVKITGQEGKLGLGALYVNDRGPLPESSDHDLGAVRLTRSLMVNSQVGCLVTSKSNADYYNRVAAADLDVQFSGFKIVGQMAQSWSNDHQSRLSLMGYGSVAYIRNDIMLAYGYGQTEENFTSDLGFITPLYIGWDLRPVSYRRHRALGSYTWQINNGWLRRLNPSIVYDTKKTYRHEEATRKISACVSTEWDKNIVVSVSANSNRTLWERQHFDQYSYDLAVSANPDTRLTVSSSYSEGQALNYWTESTVWQRFVYAEIGWNPTPKLHIAPALQTVRQYDKRGGREIYGQTNRVIRIGYAFSPKIFSRVFVQHNSLTDHYNVNFLFGLTYLPGSNFYLAYNSGYVHANSTLTKESEIVFAKLSYFWDI